MVISHYLNMKQGADMEKAQNEIKHTRNSLFFYLTSLITLLMVIYIAHVSAIIMTIFIITFLFTLYNVFRQGIFLLFQVYNLAL